MAEDTIIEQVLLVTAYKEFEYLKNFMKYASDNGIAAVIHLDKKTVDSSFMKELNKLPNIVAISEYSVPWGGIQHVYSVIKLLDIALDNWPNLKYVHVITGQDAFSRNINEFKEFFSVANKNYMSVSDASNSNAFRYKVYYRNDLISYKKTIGNIVTKVLYMIQKALHIHRSSYNGWKIYKGMLYVSINRDFAKYVSEYCKSEEGSKYLAWLKWCFIPEEFFFQTLIMNSTWIETVVNKNYRYALWQMKHGVQPGILDEDDFDTIMNYPCFFARKMSGDYSKELIRMLEFKNE